MENRDILCVSFPTWEGDYAKTIVEVMTVIADDNRVLYVDYQHTVKDFFMTLLGKANVPIKRVLGFENNLRKIKTKRNSYVYILTPLLIFPNNFLSEGWLYEKIRQLNSRIIHHSIKHALKRLDFKDVIAVNSFNPFVGVSMLDWKELKSLVYYCYDEIGAAEWSKKHGPRLELEFAKKVDAIINTSEGLYQRNLNINKKSFLVKNGVDYKLFNKGFSLATEKNDKKVVGYIGSIDDRLDYEFLKHAFENLKDVEFRFIGRVNYVKGEEILKSFDNVKLLGAHPVATLPGFLKDFNVGIIPFVDNDFTKGIYPLKINEYLAAGLPVVMTKFGQLEEFNNIAMVSLSKEEFLNNLKKAIYETTDDDSLKNSEVAKLNSWEDRVEKIYKVFEAVE